MKFQWCFKEVPQQFQVCFKSVSNIVYFKKVSRVFQGRLKSVSGEFSAGFKFLFKGVQRCFEEVSRDNPRKLLGCFKEVSMVCQGRLKGASMEF